MTYFLNHNKVQEIPMEKKDSIVAFYYPEVCASQIRKKLIKRVPWAQSCDLS